MDVTQERVFNKVARDAVVRSALAHPPQCADAFSHGPPSRAPPARWTASTPPCSRTGRLGPARRTPSLAAWRSTPTAGSSRERCPCCSTSSPRWVGVRPRACPAHGRHSPRPSFPATGHAVLCLRLLPRDLQRAWLRLAGPVAGHGQAGGPAVREGRGGEGWCGVGGGGVGWCAVADTREQPSCPQQGCSHGRRGRQRTSQEFVHAPRRERRGGAQLALPGADRPRRRARHRHRPPPTHPPTLSRATPIGPSARRR